MRGKSCWLGILACVAGCDDAGFDPTRTALLPDGGPVSSSDAGSNAAATPTQPVDLAAELPADFSALPLATPEPSGLPVFNPPAPRARFDTVAKAPRALPPISGGTLAVSAAGQVIASDPDRDQVYVIDRALQRVETIQLAAGQEPGRIASQGQRAYVALRGAGQLLTLDLSSAKPTVTTPVCAAPRGVLFDAIDQRVLVACAGGDLVSVAPDGTRVLAKTYVAPDLRDLGRDAQGVWVTQFRSANLLRLDPALRAAARQAPATVDVTLGQGPRAFAPTLAWRTVSGPEGEPFMLHQRAQSSPIELSMSSTVAGLPTAFSNAGAVVASVPQNPYGGAPSPGAVNNTFCESGVVHGTVSRFDSAHAGIALPALPQAVVPTDLSVVPDGHLLALVAPGNFLQDQERPLGSVGASVRQLFLVNSALLKASTVTGELVPSDCLQSAPRAEHTFPGEATALLFVDAKTLVVQVRSPAELHVLRLDEAEQPRLTKVLTLDPDVLRDTGHEVFHQNTGTGIACGSCHGEALDDAHLWNFGAAGVRRTQHLRGGLSARAPFHWSADLPDLNALVSDVYERRMGAKPLLPAPRAALGGWLDSLPLVPAEPGNAAAVARGRALFQAPEVGCASCHAGEALRTSGVHDVGTGGAFKVPSLRGVALRLPLMHDGCADTLAKRFDPACGGAQHGTTAQLSQAQIADLVAYLGSL